MRWSSHCIHDRLSWLELSHLVFASDSTLVVLISQDASRFTEVGKLNTNDLASYQPWMELKQSTTDEISP